jgi:MerR family transcriptional regulator, copper efflux regulator
MRISQLAERSGVPATTLRFYETAGLLPAERTASGYRTYGPEAAERLAFIGAAKQLGLSLEEIAELLKVWQEGVCAEVKADLRPRIAARIGEAEKRGVQLTAFTASLRRALQHLDELPDRPGRCDPQCGFLDARRAAAGPVDVALDRPASVEDWRQAPVACSLSADGLQERARAWRELVDRAAQEQVDGGLRLTLPVELAGASAELAAAEQECCPFLNFRLLFDGPVIHLEVRAPAEAADLMTELFEPAG